MDIKLATNNQFLLIASRQRARRKRGVRRAHVKVLDDFQRSPIDCVLIEENAAGVRNNRLPVMNPQDGILSKTKVEQQSAPVTIFRNVSYAQLTPRPRPQSSHIFLCKSNLAGKECRCYQSSERFDKLRLPISLYTSN